MHYNKKKTDSPSPPHRMGGGGGGRRLKSIENVYCWEFSVLLLYIDQFKGVCEMQTLKLLY